MEKSKLIRTTDGDSIVIFRYIYFVRCFHLLICYKRNAIEFYGFFLVIGTGEKITSRLTRVRDPFAFGMDDLIIICVVVHAENTTIANIVLPFVFALFNSGALVGYATCFDASKNAMRDGRRVI